MGKRYPGVRRVQGVGAGQSSLSVVIPRELANKIKLKQGMMLRFTQIENQIEKSSAIRVEVVSAKELK